MPSRVFLCAVSLMACALAQSLAAEAPKPVATHVGILKQLLSASGELGNVLSGIKDEAGAKAAAPKLKEIYGRMFAMLDDLQKLGPPSPEVRKQLEKLGAEGKAATDKVVAEEARLNADEKIRPILDGAKQAAQGDK